MPLSLGEWPGAGHACGDTRLRLSHAACAPPQFIILVGDAAGPSTGQLAGNASLGHNPVCYRSSTDSSWYGYMSSASRIFACVAAGRYVTIQQLGTTDAMNLCQVRANTQPRRPSLLAA